MRSLPEEAVLSGRLANEAVSRESVSEAWAIESKHLFQMN
jgi:hypothetical protein